MTIHAVIGANNAVTCMLLFEVIKDEQVVIIANVYIITILRDTHSCKYSSKYKGLEANVTKSENA